MISIEEMNEMLEEISGEFPHEFYENLNGGVILLPETKFHKKSKKNDLYILGEYHRNGNMGRFIAIYYGSFTHVYGHLPKDELKEKLTDTVKHEFRHHLESLAGERGLEVKDEQDLTEYLNK